METVKNTKKQLIHLQKNGPIATILLKSPPVNALTEELISEIEDVFSALLAEDIKVLILSGHPDYCFSAGANIKNFNQYNVEAMQTYFSKIYKMLNMVENYKIPVIAAIDKYAIGAGLELALCADIRVMDEKARLAATGVNLGLVFCTQRLPRLVGYGHAKDLLLTAKKINSIEARQIGLVQYVSSPDKVLENALEIAELIASKAPLAVESVKYAVNNGIEMPFNESIDMEYNLLSKMFSTSEFHKRVDNFINKK